ncbi:MAG TPA: PEP-CTERM sorting domain-containing protein [Vicinamibacterales bacterium]|nr:PEP-CTERM sorting domain-containing protein [Vicinamibacterales bacterium]
MKFQSQPWALGLLCLSLLPASLAEADPIVLTTTSAGSITDTNGDGTADSGGFYGSVSFAPGIAESRAFAEFDATSLNGSGILSAWLRGPIETNGNFNRGSTVNVSAYAGNGEFDLSDFARSTIAIGSFSVPAAVWNSSFEIEVTDAVRQLLAQNATWIGFRFDGMTSFMEPIIVGGHAGSFGVTLSVEEAPAVPEPGTLLLLATGLGTLIGVRRRRPATQV